VAGERGGRVLLAGVERNAVRVGGPFGGGKHVAKFDEGIGLGWTQKKDLDLKRFSTGKQGTRDHVNRRDDGLGCWGSPERGATDIGRSALRRGSKVRNGVGGG